MTVPGRSGSHLPQGMDAGHYSHEGTAGASPPGSMPWRTGSTRVAVSDAAKESATLTSKIRVADVDLNMAPYPGAAPRKDYIEFLTGLATVTTADRVVFGTFYDDYSVTAYLGEMEMGCDARWLQYVYATPDGTTALSTPEWAALWNGTPPLPYLGRLVDLAGCSFTMTLTVDLVDTSELTGGSPAFTIREDPTATYAGQYRKASLINGLASIGSISGVARSVPFTNPGWLDPFNNPIGTPVIDSSQIADVTQPLNPVGSSTGPGTVRVEYVAPASLWVDGFDPGYDETGVAPPPSGGAVFHGGDGANWYARARVSITGTYTIRQRWVGFTTAIPPLWQRQRIGAVDSPESYSSGLVTPQSSPWQGGTL